MEIDEFLIDIQSRGYMCLRCGNMWIPRKKKGKPQSCPRCRNRAWDKPRKE